LSVQDSESVQNTVLTAAGVIGSSCPLLLRPNQSSPGCRHKAEDARLNGQTKLHVCGGILSRYGLRPTMSNTSWMKERRTWGECGKARYPMQPRRVTASRHGRECHSKKTVKHATDEIDSCLIFIHGTRMTAHQSIKADKQHALSHLWDLECPLTTAQMNSWDPFPHRFDALTFRALGFY